MPDKFGKIEEPLDILVEYGYLDDSNIPYHRALNIAVNDFSNDETLGGDENREILEILQKEAKKELKLRRKKINVSKFFGKEKKKTAEDTTGKSNLAVRSKTGKIDTKKLIPEPTQEKGGVLAEILTGVNSIVDTLKGEKKQDKKHFSFLRKMIETFKRRKKENKLEFKVFEGLKNTVTKVLEPMKSAWSKFIEFVGNILLGNVLFKILNWMGNPENQGKLNSIIKFFEDWWPVLLGGYLIFGNALTGFAMGLLKNVVVWGAKLVATVIPALLKAAVAMGPWGLAAVAVLGTAAVLSTKKNKTDQKVDQSVDEVGREETVNKLKEEKEDKNLLEKMGGVVTGEGQERDEQIQRVETGEERSYGRGGFTGELINNMVNPVGSKLGFGFKEGGLVQHYNNATQQASNIIQAFNEGGTVMNNQNMMGDQIQNKEQFNILNPFNIIRLLGTMNQADEGEGQFGGGFTGRMMERRRTLAETQGLKQGGFVSGPGGVDKVPARLTAGEFVMSKGAVQKYGVNTLKSMNAAGGGTNIPTLMGGKPGYAGGGEVTSYQQLIEEGGTVDDSGNMGGMRSIDVVFPIEKSGFFGRKRTRRTNRFLFDGGQEVTMPIEDLINIKLFDSGSQAESVTSKRSDGTGFIKGMGNLMSGKTFSGEDRVKPQRSRGQGNKIKAVRRKSMETNIEPSEKKKNVIRAYEQEKNKMSDSPNVEKSNSEIPQFDVTLGRSAPKIKVLGISV